MISIQNKDSTSFTFEQLPSFCHDLRHQTLQVVLLLKYAPRESQQDLVPLVLEYWRFEELSILDANAAEREVPFEYFHISCGEFFGTWNSYNEIISKDKLRSLITVCVSLIFGNSGSNQNTLLCIRNFVLYQLLCIRHRAKHWLINGIRRAVRWICAPHKIFFQLSD